MTKSIRIDRALQSLTKLSIDAPERYSFLLYQAKFENLSELHLNCCPEEGSDNFRLQISQLRDLPKLKKLSLSFEVQSFACEAQFFENFIVPSTVENLDLTLIGFEWNEMSVTD